MKNKRKIPLIVGVIFITSGILVAISGQGILAIFIASILVYFGWANLKMATHAKTELIDEILDTKKPLSKVVKKEINKIIG